MRPYAERRAARIARLEDRAAAKTDEATAAFKRTDQIANGIPKANELRAGTLFVVRPRLMEWRGQFSEPLTVGPQHCRWSLEFMLASDERAQDLLDNLEAVPEVPSMQLTRKEKDAWALEILDELHASGLVTQEQIDEALARARQKANDADPNETKTK